MGFLKKWFGGAEAPLPPQPQEDLGAALMRLTREYWTPAPGERAQLEPGVESLPWPKLLRLHHLVCLELLHANGLTTDGGAMDLPESPAAALWVKTAARLASPESPFHPRSADVLQRARGPNPGKLLSGDLRNASSSHFGALEVMRLENNHPVALDFVPFGELARVGVGPRSLFPPAQLLYRDGKKDVVCLPLIYGASWFSAQATDQDGSMTRFVLHHRGVEGGVGLGHQDFTSGGALFGLGSVQQIDFG